MGSRSELWFYAQQCVDAAARTTDESHKQFMLDMAKTLRRLATGETPSQELGLRGPPIVSPDSPDERAISPIDRRRSFRVIW
jgi:hypothetical protein